MPDDCTKKIACCVIISGVISRTEVFLVLRFSVIFVSDVGIVILVIGIHIVVSGLLVSTCIVRWSEVEMCNDRSLLGCSVWCHCSTCRACPRGTRRERNGWGIGSRCVG